MGGFDVKQEIKRHKVIIITIIIIIYLYAQCMTSKGNSTIRINTITRSVGEWIKLSYLTEALN